MKSTRQNNGIVSKIEEAVTPQDKKYLDQVENGNKNCIKWPLTPVPRQEKADELCNGH